MDLIRRYSFSLLFTKILLHPTKEVLQLKDIHRPEEALDSQCTYVSISTLWVQKVMFTNKRGKVVLDDKTLNHVQT